MSCNQHTKEKKMQFIPTIPPIKKEELNCLIIEDDDSSDRNRKKTSSEENLQHWQHLETCLTSSKTKGSVYRQN